MLHHVRNDRYPGTTAERVGLREDPRNREELARVVVDATQLAGARVVDTVGWGADALVTNGYKWLSSHGGVALLALAPDLGTHHGADMRSSPKWRRCERLREEPR
jgi:selenocysteine lyase/cysteine desulfurase